MTPGKTPVDPKLLYAVCQEDTQQDQNHQNQNTTHNFLSSLQKAEYGRIGRISLGANEHMVRRRIVAGRVDRTIGILLWYHLDHHVTAVAECQ